MTQPRKSVLNTRKDRRSSLNLRSSKSNRSVLKRLSVTGSGKVKTAKEGNRHLASNKTSSQIASRSANFVREGNEIARTTYFLLGNPDNSTLRKRNRIAKTQSKMFSLQLRDMNVKNKWKSTGKIVNGKIVPSAQNGKGFSDFIAIQTINQNNMQTVKKDKVKSSSGSKAKNIKKIATKKQVKN